MIKDQLHKGVAGPFTFLEFAKSRFMAFIDERFENQNTPAYTVNWAKEWKIKMSSFWVNAHFVILNIIKITHNYRWCMQKSHINCVKFTSQS